jgi:hypothetical protein
MGSYWGPSFQHLADEKKVPYGTTTVTSGEVVQRSAEELLELVLVLMQSDGVPEAIMNNTSTLSLSNLRLVRGMETNAAQGFLHQCMQATWVPEYQSLSRPRLAVSR